MEYLMYISMKMGLTVMFQAGFVLVQTIALGSFSQIFGGTIPQKLIWKKWTESEILKSVVKESLVNRKAQPEWLSRKSYQLPHILDP